MSLTKEQESILVDRMNRFRPPIGVEANNWRGSVLELSINSLVLSIADLHEIVLYLLAAALPEYNVVDKKK